MIMTSAINQKKIKENSFLGYDIKIIKDSKDALRLLDEILMKRRIGKINK